MLLSQEALEIGYLFQRSYSSKNQLGINLPVLWLAEKKKLLLFCMIHLNLCNSKNGPLKVL